MAKPPFELLSNGIIKNLFLNVNRQTEALTFVLSSKVERKDKGRKDLTAPLTFVLSRRGREEMEGKNLKAPLTLALSRMYRLRAS